MAITDSFTQDPILWAFFQRIRNLPGYQLGLEDYFILLDSASKCATVKEINKIELYNICCKIWLKPGINPSVFRTMWYEYFGQLDYELSLIFPKKDSDAAETSTKSDYNSKIEKKDKINKETDENMTADPFDTDLQNEHEETELSDEDVYLEVQQSSGQSENEKYLEKDINDRFHFRFLSNYFPVSMRNLQQSWRSLHIGRYSKQLSREVDIDAMVKQISTTGLLNEIPYIRNKENITRLVIMLDHKGSMVAFKKLTQMLIEAATEGAGLDCVVYYFINLPRNVFFTNRSHTSSLTIAEVIEKERAHKSSVVIISEAGSARGNLNESRINGTIAWLDRLREISSRIAWINPMPKDRWVNSSAEFIEDYVPMFEASEEGLRHAVKVLRGKISSIKE